MWEVTFTFSGGGNVVHMIDPVNFDIAVQKAKEAAAFFSQRITDILINVEEE